MFGGGDGACIDRVGRWSAEEGRHSIVLRDYLTVTRNLDLAVLSSHPWHRSRRATSDRR
jgi:hypothetical protein